MSSEERRPSTSVISDTATLQFAEEGSFEVSYFAVDSALNAEPTTTIQVRVDKTAPTITSSQTPAANAAGWNNSDVTVSFSGDDVLSGIDFCSAAVVLISDGAGQSASGTCTDLAGNVSALATASGINIDEAPPTASASASPGPNANGWNNTDVTVSYSAADALSGIDAGASDLADGVLSAEGAGQSATGTAVDLAGNIASVTVPNINIDKTAPTASASASPGPNANGWNNTDVTVSFTGDDDLSGIASCSAPFVLTIEGAEQSASGTCTDLAGNVSAQATASGINIDKTAPTPVHGGPFSVDEGSSIPVDGTNSTDALSGVGSTAWALDGDIVYDDGDPATFNGIDDSINPVSLRVVDYAGNEAIAPTQVTVNNVAPTINAITTPVDPVNISDQSSVAVEVSFSDPGTEDTHNVTWEWGDGTPADTQSGATSPASQGHTYDTPGVYRVTVTVTDDDGGSDTATYEFIVIYDPEGGFVTGGGWIWSPEGACPRCDASPEGKANFGFVSKYKKGATVPTGQTEFQFPVANLNFHSTSYQWLVIAGPKAKFKGSGTINGSGDYGFMLTATDGRINGGGGVDKFWIKIWDRDNGDAVVYDNQMGDTDDADATDAIEGGSIVIHKNKKK